MPLFLKEVWEHVLPILDEYCEKDRDFYNWQREICGDAGQNPAAFFPDIGWIETPLTRSLRT